MTQALKLKPNFFEAQNDRGFVHLQRGQYDKAIADFTDVIQKRRQKQSDSPNPHNHRGSAYLALGRLPEAIADFKKALKIDPGFRPARDNLARAREDFSLLRPGQVFLNETRSGEEILRHGRWLEGRLRQYRGNDIEQERIVKQWRALSEECGRGGDWLSALRVTQELLSALLVSDRREDVAPTRLRLADIHQRLGDDKRAGMLYEKVSQDKSGSAWSDQATVGLARLAARKEDWRTVGRYVGKISNEKTLPPSAQRTLRVLRVRMKARKGQAQQALEQARRWLREAPGETAALELAGELAQQLERFPLAALYHEAQARAARRAGDLSGEVQAWHRVGLTRVRQKQWPQARLALSRAVKAAEKLRATLRGREGAALRLLGETFAPYRLLLTVLVEQGQAERALELLDASNARSLADSLSGKLKTRFPSNCR